MVSYHGFPLTPIWMSRPAETALAVLNIVITNRAFLFHVGLLLDFQVLFDGFVQVGIPLCVWHPAASVLFPVLAALVLIPGAAGAGAAVSTVAAHTFYGVGFLMFCRLRHIILHHLVAHKTGDFVGMVFTPFNAIIDLAVALHCFVDWAALTVHPAGAILCARLIYI